MEAHDAVYPVRAPVPWTEEGGAVVVLLPKRLDRLSRGVRALVRGPSHLRVPLDEVGSRAFRLADGSRTARALAEELEREFGERAGPPDRALRFLATLARNGILRLADAPGPPPAPPGPPPRELACPACQHRFHVAEPAGTRLRCPRCGRRADG